MLVNVFTVIVKRVLVVNSLDLSVFRNLKKQPPEVFFKESCSQKFGNIHWKTPVLESLLNKGL